jgi:hypothetical protein
VPITEDDREAVGVNLRNIQETGAEEVEVEYVSAPREYEDLLVPEPSSTSTAMNGFTAAGSSRPTGRPLSPCPSRHYPL